MRDPIPRPTLEQWAVLKAVVEAGSFEAAAEALGRSQSSISYALKRLQEQVPVAILRQAGRRTRLTPAGETLLRGAEHLLDSAQQLAERAANLARGWESEVRLAVDNICPPDLVLRSLAEFSERAPQTRVQLFETVLSGTTEALVLREADLAVSGQLPVGFAGDPLVDIEILAVAHHEHPLHKLQAPIRHAELNGFRQVVVRDTGVHRQVDAGWLGAEQRWTVSHLRTAIETIRRGLAFAWVPRAYVEDELRSGLLRRLPLLEGAELRAQLHLVFADRDSAGPASQALAEILRSQARRSGSV